ncbi:hypothetical protein GGR53DRAFT_464342 [Hypoxylon sp. FL1150]|nr:hypothetical protein GGR53DRAFT_464342 [Hypoxylon sp. FL1150]
MGFFTAQEQISHFVNSDDHFFCQRCSKDFARPEELTKHYTVPATWSPGVEHFYCSKCFSDFEHADSLKDHHFYSNVHSYCPVCDEHFSTEEELMTHFKSRWLTHHYCKTCEIPFKTKIDLLQHSVQNPTTHVCCQPCQRVFTDKVALADHKIWDSCLEPNSYCVECEKDFHDEEVLSLHQQARHANQYCSDCGEHFLQFDDLNDHKHVDHQYQRCRTCPDQFPNIEALNIHRYMKHPYCMRCDETFKSLDDMTAHIEGSNRHHVCQHCQLDLEEVESLMLHLRTQHLCQRCDVYFPSVTALENHKIHSDQHHYCEECLLECRDEVDLSRHHETQHYRCNNCSEFFGTSKALSIHWSKCISDCHSEAKTENSAQENRSELETLQDDGVSQGYDTPEECDTIQEDVDVPVTSGDSDGNGLQGYDNINPQEHVGHHENVDAQDNDSSQGCISTLAEDDAQNDETLHREGPLEEHGDCRKCTTSSEEGDKLSNDISFQEGVDHNENVGSSENGIFHESISTLADSGASGQDDETPEEYGSFQQDTSSQKIIDALANDTALESDESENGDPQEHDYFRDNAGIQHLSWEDFFLENDTYREYDSYQKDGSSRELSSSREEVNSPEDSDEQGGDAQSDGHAGVNAETDEAETRVQCIDCTARFPSIRAMVHHCEEGTSACWKKLHLSLRYGDGDGLFTQVNEEFLTGNGGPNTLIEESFNTSAGTYDCWRCGLGFKHMNGLVIHFNNLLHLPLQFKCPQAYCGEVFSKFYGLLDHLEEDIDCGEWLGMYGGNKLEELKAYMVAHHTEEGQ